VRRPARRPRRTAVSKSRERRMRCVIGSTIDRRTAAGSGGQLGTTLAPARGENGATRSGPHTQPETMGLCPAPVVRLEGPLAHQKTPRSCCERDRETVSGLLGDRQQPSGRRSQPCPSRAGDNGRCQASTRYGRAHRRVKPAAVSRPGRRCCSEPFESCGSSFRP
jgi:hypothetical protein